VLSHRSVPDFDDLTATLVRLGADAKIKPVGKIISNKNAEQMKTYYAIVNVEDRRFRMYVLAANVAAAFGTATARDKTRHPRLHAETIAVQEIAEEVKRLGSRLNTYRSGVIP
jgi:hypothetical protein